MYILFESGIKAVFDGYIGRFSPDVALEREVVDIRVPVRLTKAVVINLDDHASSPELILFSNKSDASNPLKSRGFELVTPSSYLRVV